ncbi:MAG: phosphate/phosphite/phosphonate ABC transporter substrate-binding protein [Ardenticatenaceae bacterium]|nr:phosphate/phosphite/phosphonate ABC transporter substrate-binding protein [Ardenticatenaceae bacterium]
MIHKTLFPTFLLALVLAIAGCTTTIPNEETVDTSSEPNEVVEAAGLIVIGDISDEPIKKIERHQPLADYLAANLSEYGIGKAEVKIAQDMETMIQWIEDGEVDIYMDSLYPAMIIADATGATPILRRWKKDVAEYHTVFFTRADSELAALEDLTGQIVAFEEPNSTSGYMLPHAFLIEADLNPLEVASISSAVSDDAVGYAFSGEDQNTLQWVISGEAAAGATDNYSYEEVVEESEVELKVLAQTEDVPRGVVIARGDLGDEVISKISSLMMGLVETDEGLEILDTNKTGQFDEFPDGLDLAFERMRELYAMIETAQ